MADFGEEVDDLIAFHTDRDAKNADARREALEWRRRRLAHLRQLGQDSSRYLLDKGVRPLPALGNPHPGGPRDHYKIAVVDCYAWPMGRLALSEDGEFIGGHRPWKARESIPSVTLSVWGYNQGSGICRSRTGSSCPTHASSTRSRRFGVGEFLVYSYSAEESRPVSEHVRHYAAMLTLYGREFTDVTWDKIHRDY